MPTALRMMRQSGGLSSSRRSDRDRWHNFELVDGQIGKLPPAPLASSPAARAVMLANRGDTVPELALRSELHRRGFRFRKNQPPIQGLRCKADIVFRSASVAVFVDGCFWHLCPQHATFPKTNAEWWRIKLKRNFERDRRNDAALVEAGWTVARIWEHEDLTAAADRVEMIVKARASR